MASLSGEPSGRIGYGVVSVASSSLSTPRDDDDDDDEEDDEDARAVLLRRDDDTDDAYLVVVLLANVTVVVANIIVVVVVFVAWLTNEATREGARAMDCYYMYYCLLFKRRCATRRRTCVLYKAVYHSCCLYRVTPRAEAKKFVKWSKYPGIFEMPGR